MQSPLLCKFTNLTFSHVFIRLWHHPFPQAPSFLLRRRHHPFRRHTFLLMLRHSPFSLGFILSSLWLLRLGLLPSLSLGFMLSSIGFFPLFPYASSFPPYRLGVGIIHFLRLYPFLLRLIRLRLHLFPQASSFSLGLGFIPFIPFLRLHQYPQASFFSLGLGPFPQASSSSLGLGFIPFLRLHPFPQAYLSLGLHTFPWLFGVRLLPFPQAQASYLFHFLRFHPFSQACSGYPFCRLSAFLPWAFFDVTDNGVRGHSTKAQASPFYFTLLLRLRLHLFTQAQASPFYLGLGFTLLLRLRLHPFTQASPFYPLLKVTDLS